MYTQEQLQEAMKTAQTNRKEYTENSIEEARKEWDEACVFRQSVENGEQRSIFTVHELKQREADKRAKLDDAIRNSSHLVEAKRLRDLQSAQEAEKRKAQQEQAAAEKSAYLAQLKEKWLATGGSEHSWGENKEGM